MTDLWSGTTALITGASRGIGAAFADALAARGANLILVARNAGTLEPVAERARRLGQSVQVLPDDLEDPAAPARLVEAIERLGLTVDHLINNAGIGPNGLFHGQPPETHLPTIAVNVRAVVDLSARLLPGMVARRRGGLINIASTSAWQGLKWLPVYSGSKAFVVTWSEAVWTGLRGTGVRCCCVSPGPVDTGFFEANRLDVAVPAWAMQSAEAVVRRALAAYQRDRCHTITFLPFRLLAWSTRLAPRSLAARLGSWYAAPQ
ncbi:MAG TPA: SDR family NAD(P)-dependent oxidoreductase [Gemmatimonadales bacterium]|nr:SDR family NAD(P)-dependent oxidoreductase [Gemmatimonadales bacterium]